MKITGTIFALFASMAAATSLGSTTTQTVSYDTGYDQASRSMDDVACSDGTNGLITRYGWKTQGAIPRFPMIGGVYTIAGYNSAQCGTCYEVAYKGNKIHVLGIDHAASGLNIAKAAMNKLTNGQAVQLGRVNAAVTQVGVSKCGLTPKREIEFNA